MEETMEEITIDIPEGKEEVFYADISEDHTICGFYSNKIHSSIPETAIEIEKEIRKYILNSGKQYRIKDTSLPITLGNLEELDLPEAEPTAFEKLRADVDFLMIMEGFTDV